MLTATHSASIAAATMNGRRRHPRFLLPEALTGSLRVREEVAVERWDERELEILAATPCRPGERLVLEVAGNGQRSLHVTVRESHPVVGGDGAIRHRVILSVVSNVGNGSVTEGVAS